MSIDEQPTAIRITGTTDPEKISRLVQQIDEAEWDDANDIGGGQYTTDSLSRFVANPNMVFVACHIGEQFAGMASGALLDKPYADERWLYIDEVDTCVNMRRRGAGRAIMNALLEIADEHDAEEAWLGTEPDNTPALALYRSLPDNEEEAFVGFTFPLDDDPEDDE